MIKVQQLAASLLAFAAAHADASVITLQTAKSTATAQKSADAYRTVVEQALLTQGAGYGTKTLAAYDNISNGNQFASGANGNIAWKATIEFGLAEAASFSFRSGVDFGYGGALFLDGNAITFRSTDMYWAGSYNNASQFLQGTSALDAGNHVLTIYGLEGCCDGVQQAQYKIGNGQFMTFAATDGLNLQAAAVPEPATLATFVLGLGLAAAARRRKRG